MNPCTCTLACIPAGITEGQTCRLREDVVDPAITRECDGYPGLVVPANAVDALAAGKSFVTTPGELTAALEELEARYGPLECCGDPGDCGTCGP